MRQAVQDHPVAVVMQALHKRLCHDHIAHGTSTVYDHRLAVWRKEMRVEAKGLLPGGVHLKAEAVSDGFGGEFEAVSLFEYFPIQPAYHLIFRSINGIICNKFIIPHCVHKPITPHAKPSISHISAILVAPWRTDVIIFKKLV